ncbi:uncharacterized protein [Watersipora subatra]|uniref:uncharacterized protein n=1 Tax=Watersipora subatra TaxID=2589382 RepID=UPI00355AEF09
MKNIEAKTVVLGAQGVGKTSVVKRCVENVFESRVESTIGAAFSSYKIVVNGYKVHLQIWDTAGQERFKAMAPMFYRKASFAILVYDITDMESFDAVKIWVRELIQNVDKPVAMILFGNKCDLTDKRQVSRETAEEYAMHIGAELVEMSALSNQGVEEGFEKVALGMISRIEDSHAQVYDTFGNKVTNGNRNVSLLDSDSVDSRDEQGCRC